MRMYNVRRHPPCDDIIPHSFGAGILPQVLLFGSAAPPLMMLIFHLLGIMHPSLLPLEQPLLLLPLLLRAMTQAPGMNKRLQETCVTHLFEAAVLTQCRLSR